MTWLQNYQIIIQKLTWCDVDKGTNHPGKIFCLWSAHFRDNYNKYTHLQTVADDSLFAQSVFFKNGECFFTLLQTL